MVLKEFSMEVPGRGRVDVSFYLHFDTHTINIDELKIHADFDSGLPHHAQLKQDQGQWILYAEHPNMENGQVVVTPQYYNDDLSRAVAERVLAYKNAES
jgi:hypothetical protein